MRVNVSIDVSQPLAEAIQAQISGVVQAVLPTMVEEAEKIRALSMEVVPVDQGHLRASAMEVGINPEATDNSATVAIGYGGAARSYAVMQHETPPDVFSHAPGQSWKYLERPTLESAPAVREALTEAVLRAFSGSGGAGGATFGGGE